MARKKKHKRFQPLHQIEIPRGDSREEIKERKRIIGDFYAKWNAEHPEKRVWNKSLNDFIYVKYQSINETKGHAALSYKSTMAVFHLTMILKHARLVEKWAPKHDDNNQKPYSRMHLMRWKTYRLIVGFQKSNNEYVQYYVGSI